MRNNKNTNIKSTPAVSQNNHSASPNLPSISVDDFNNLLREATEYANNRNTMFKKLVDEKTKHSQYTFTFPFFLNENDIEFFDNIIRERINGLYNNHFYDINFSTTVEFKNNDSSEYLTIDELKKTSIESIAKKIKLHWRYYQDIPFEKDGRIIEIFQIPFDIVIEYETQQNYAKREEHTFEEFGYLYVEGLEYDWINSTLQEIKVALKSTKMPPWWFALKFITLKIRPFVAIWVWLVLLNVLVIVIINMAGAESKEVFVQEYYNIVTIEEKTDKIFQWLTRPTDNSLIWIYAICVGVSAVLYLVVNLIWRYIAPPSMISTGKFSIRHNRIIITIYNFVYLTIIISGIVIPIIVSKF